MKKFTLLILALAVQVAEAAPAKFTGFYAGGYGGATLLDLDIDQSFDIEVPGIIDLSFPIDTGVEGNGAAGWVGVGYSHQFSNHIVLGAEATAGLSNVKVAHNHAITVFGFPISGKAKTELKNDFALLFKPGYVIKQNTQVYALVGPRWGYFKSTLTTLLQTMTFEDSVSEYELGITAGAGITHMITENLSFGIEYAYTSYGEINSPEVVTSVDVGFGTPVPAADTTALDVSTNTLAAQLSYHF